MKTSELILQAAADIEGILNAHQMPGPAPTVVDRLRFVASQLNGLDHNASGNAFRIVDIANDFYTARKHWKYQGGAVTMWRDMLMYLDRVGCAASIRKSNGD